MKKSIKISDLELNEGQVPGLPRNPRFIRDDRFEALKKSISDAPEMLELRELLVYPSKDGKFVVVGGNMRLRACRELGFDEIPCKVIGKDVDVRKLREYAIKDNNEFGQNDFDILASDWDVEELKDFGLDSNFLNDAEWDKLPTDGVDAGDPQNSENFEYDTLKVLVPKEESEHILDSVREAVTKAVEKWTTVQVK